MRRPALVLGLALVLAGCGKGGQPAAGGPPGGGMPPPPVPVASPIVRDLPVTRELTGRLESPDFVELKPRVSGVIEKVAVADGAEVKAGDVLLEIDPKPSQAAVARAEAQAARADANLGLARQQFARGEQMLAQQLISPQQHDDLAAGVRVAEADVAAGKAAVETAKLDLGYTRVTAPIAGRIGKVLTTVGNLVQGGGPVPATTITTIVSIDPVDAVFDLDEATWRKLGQALRGSQGGGAEVPVGVGIAGEDGYPHPGVVRFVDNRVDTASGSIRIRARVANPDRVLTPGAFARVQLQIEPPKPTVLVNERAVLTQLTTRFVLVVDEHGLTQVRPVRLGGSVGALRIVEDGLKPGERIAVGGMAVSGFGKMFFPGMPVSPMPASMETLQPAGAPPEAPAPTAAAPAKPTPAADEGAAAPAERVATDATEKPEATAAPESQGASGASTGVTGAGGKPQ